MNVRPKRIDKIKPKWNPNDVDEEFLKGFMSKLSQIVDYEVTNEEKALKLLS